MCPPPPPGRAKVAQTPGRARAKDEHNTQQLLPSTTLCIEPEDPALVATNYVSGLF